MYSYQSYNFCAVCGGYFSKSYKPSYKTFKGVKLAVHEKCKNRLGDKASGVDKKWALKIRKEQVEATKHNK